MVGRTASKRSGRSIPLLRVCCTDRRHLVMIPNNPVRLRLIPLPGYGRFGNSALLSSLAILISIARSGHHFAPGRSESFMTVDDLGW